MYQLVALLLFALRGVSSRARRKMCFVDNDEFRRVPQ